MQVLETSANEEKSFLPDSAPKTTGVETVQTLTGSIETETPQPSSFNFHHQTEIETTNQLGISESSISTQMCPKLGSSPMITLTSERDESGNKAETATDDKGFYEFDGCLTP